MKKILLSIIVLMIASFGQRSSAQNTDGTLTVTFNETAGSYTSNVYAIWIENAAGTFIKTKNRYVSSGTNDHLPTWMSKSSGGVATTATSSSCNVTDALTGSTRKSTTTPTGMGAKSITWDGKNVSGTSNGTTVADGIYKVWVESSWNPNTANNSHGTIISWSFTKGAVVDHQTPANVTQNTATFSNIVLEWVPTGMVSIDQPTVKEEPQLYAYPNPSQGEFNLSFYKVNSLRVVNQMGAVVIDEKIDPTTVHTTIDLSNYANGIYYITVANETGTASKKVILEK